MNYVVDVLNGLCGGRSEWIIRWMFWMGCVGGYLWWMVWMWMVWFAYAESFGWMVWMDVGIECWW